MKKIGMIVLALGVLFLPALHAQTTSLTPAVVAAAAAAVSQTDPFSGPNLPMVGLFYSVRNPELPGVPGNFHNLPVWDLGDGNFLLDDHDSRTGGRTMDDDPPSPPSDGGEGGDFTNFSGGGNPFYGFPTNTLWMQLISVSNGMAYLNLCNASNYVYEIFSKTNLDETNWGIETEVFPINGDVMPFTVPVLDRTNTLFFWSRDWDGIVSDGNTTVQEWWLYEFFGSVDLSETNLDSQGRTLLWDYTNGQDPNVISFSPSVTNQYVNNANMPVQLAVTAGWPYSVAVSVDDSNYMADATWQDYAGTNISVNLGSTEGWHEVWIGLRGRPASATQTWQSLRVNLDLTPPVLTILSPTSSVTSQPIVELEGMSDRPISQISYDIQNDAGTNTGWLGTVTGQIIDPITSQFTSNTFQCFDVPLTNGLNTITLQVTDRAGNTATTNIALTLDFSGDTTPPAITMFWPQNGDTIAGTGFTLRGSLDDFTAALTAQIVDTNGDTNIIAGEIERNGLYWIENAPLAAGTNYITLTATDAAGNVSVTNLTVNNIGLAVTINSFTNELGGDPRNIIPTVTGTVTLTNYTVWVNGVKATESGGTNWEAVSVPLGPGGSAVVEARAIPDSDNSGNGTGTLPPSDGTPSNPTGPGSIAAQTQTDQPTVCYRQSYQSSTTNTWLYVDYSGFRPVFTNAMTFKGRVNAVYGAGGTAAASNDCDIWTFNWPCDQCAVTSVETPCSSETNTSTVSLAYALQEAQYGTPLASELANAELNLDLHYAIPDMNQIGDPTSETVIYDLKETLSTQMMLQTGGKGLLTQQNLFEMDVFATNYVPVLIPDSAASHYVASLSWDIAPMAPGQVTVAGQTLDASNQADVVLPNNVTMDVTPQIPSQSYTYGITVANRPTTLMGLTVVSGATQIDATDCVVVMNTNNPVELEAIDNDPAAISALQWSGGLEDLGQPPVLSNKKLRFQSAAVSKMYPITVSLATTKFTMNVWVIWADLTIKTTGTLDPDDKAPVLVNNNTDWPTPTNYNVTFSLGGNGLGGGSGLGPIDCIANTNLNYCFTIGKMEAKATLNPPGIANLITNGWKLRRTATYIFWNNGGAPTVTSGGTIPPSPTDDTTPYSQFQYLNLAASALFDLDYPGCPSTFGTTVNHTAETYANFYEYLTVTLGSLTQACSYSNTYSYEAQIDADAPNKVQANLLSTSLITLPTNSIYSPR